MNYSSHSLINHDETQSKYFTDKYGPKYDFVEIALKCDTVYCTFAKSLIWDFLWTVLRKLLLSAMWSRMQRD